MHISGVVCATSLEISGREVGGLLRKRDNVA